jgi:hypothetical protein
MRPSPRGKSSKRIIHGDSLSGNPGAPEIISHGTGGGGGAGGKKAIKGPGAQASIKGKVKGMGGK